MPWKAGTYSNEKWSLSPYEVRLYPSLAGRLAIVVAAASLAACGATNPLQQAGQGIMGALTSDAGRTDVSSQKPVVLKIPNDPGIQPRKVAPYSTVIVRDVGYDSRSVQVIANAQYYRLRFENLTPGSFVVHARTDNGVAGSGVKYDVNFNVQESPKGYQVAFQPMTRNAYQQGLIGKFPVPNFNDADLRTQLTSLQIVYRFEVDSPYNSESVTANFMRLARPMTARQGWADPVTGKIYSSYFVSTLHGRDMTYVTQVYPYHNGSKAVITAVITGVETAPDTVDFGVLINDARHMLENIAKS
ncbi:hypothetical protein GPU89_11310 [Burkholderia cepacia]|nr:hypothetical protein [Burkholderia cepacia]